MMARGEYPNAPVRMDGESQIDFVLREIAYNDGRFGKPYGTGLAAERVSLGSEIDKASTDDKSLQARVSAFKDGIADRKTHNLELAKTVAKPVALALAVIVGIVWIRRK